MATAVIHFIAAGAANFLGSLCGTLHYIRSALRKAFALGLRFFSSHEVAPDLS